MVNVLMLLSKSFSDDVRVGREVKVLTANGYNVTVFSWNKSKAIPRFSINEKKLEVIMIGPSCRKRSFYSMIFKLPLFWFSCLLHSACKEFSVVHAHDLDTLPIGYFISRIRGSRLVYDSHESYADMIADDMPRIIVHSTRIMQKWLLKSTDIVIVANKKIASLIGTEKAIVVMNCPTEAELPSLKIENRETSEAEVKSIGYFGSFESGRFLIEAIDTISKQPSWKLTLAGDGALIEAVEEAVKNCISTVYLGKLPHDQAMARAASCDVILVMFDPSNANNVIGSPNRLFEAMSLGIPSIVTRGTYAAEIALSEKCGFICDFDEGSFVELLDHIASSPVELMEMGKRGRAAFEREYNWENQALKLIQAYSEIDNRE